MSPIELVLSKLEGVKPRGNEANQWSAFCPCHKGGNEKRQSLSVGVGRAGAVVMRCYSGCTLEEIVDSMGMTTRQLYEGTVPEPTDNGVTVGRLGFHKNIPTHVLRDYGLRDAVGKREVEIVYRDVKGEELYVRRRTALRAKEGTYQQKGMALKPYGLWKLDQWKEQASIVIVEGESDCWALWHWGFAALGLPGASTSAALDVELLEGFARVVVWKEPGDGGSEFAESVTRRLAVKGYKGKICVLSGGNGVKDPSDIAARMEEDFPAYFKKLIDEAEELKVEGNEVSKVTGTIPEPVKRRGLTSSPYGWGEFGCTDTGNAERLVKAYGKDIMYVVEWKKWYIWNGRNWEQDCDGHEVEKKADLALFSIWWESRLAPTEEAKRFVEKWGVTSEGLDRIAKAVKGARRMCAVSYKSLDTHHDILPVANGTVELRTGLLRESRREDMMTASSPVNYVPGKKGATWDSFLDKVFPDDLVPGVMGYVKALLGYCTSGVVSDALMPIFWGEGRNGKSTLIKAFQRVIGDKFTMNAPTGMLMQKRNESHPTELASLYGKRAVFSIETSENERLDVEIVKKLTGNDIINARKLYEDFWSFMPTFKVVMCTNHMPTVSADDKAIWARLARVPFKTRFWNPDKDETGEEKYKVDPTIDAKLVAENEAVLAWLVEGAKDFFENGLKQPECVVQGTKEYREDEDVIGRFISECTAKSDGGKVSRGDLYQTYTKWCEEQGMKPYSAVRFTKSVAKKWSEQTTSRGVRYWKGMSRIQPTEVVTDLDEL